MRKLILMICLVFSYGILSAQGSYEKGMAKGMEMMKNSKTSEEFIATANHFERIANVEKKEWLPKYWNAYSLLIAGMNAKKESEQDALYDKAFAVAELIDLQNADNSELLTLKAYITLMRISVSPMTRAPLGTPAAMGMLTDAQNANPKNPRPLYIMGQNTFYTPEFFGGGKEKAKPMLASAVDLYAAELPSKDFMPRWGKGRTEFLLKECK